MPLRNFFFEKASQYFKSMVPYSGLYNLFQSLVKPTLIRAIFSHSSLSYFIYPLNFSSSVAFLLFVNKLAMKKPGVLGVAIFSWSKAPKFFLASASIGLRLTDKSLLLGYNFEAFLNKDSQINEHFVSTALDLVVLEQDVSSEHIDGLVYHIISLEISLACRA